MAYRPPNQPGQGNFTATGNQQPRPGNAQFMQPRSYAGVAPQRYGMMQPGMAPGGYTPQMYPGQVPPQGVMGVGQVPMGYPQQAQMAHMGQQQMPHGYQMMQQQKRMAEAQQQFTEKQKRERYMEEQRHKLRQFSKGGTAALGTTKLDFDNLLGTKDTPGRRGSTGSRPVMQQQRASSMSQPQHPAETDDSFGDFHQGPTTTAPAPQSSAGATGPKEPHGTDDDFGDFLQGPGVTLQGGLQGSQAMEAEKPVPGKDTSVEHKEEDVKAAGPTLESLMMASTDFSTNTAQKTKPTKKTLIDSKPTHPVQQIPQATQKAQAWTSTQNFTGMFPQDLPQAAGMFPGGVPQGSVVGPGVLQGALVGPGVPHGAVVGPGVPQGAVVGPGVPQGAVVGPGVPQGAVVGPGVPQGSVIGRGIQQGAVVGPGVPQGAVVGPGVPQGSISGPVPGVPQGSVAGPFPGGPFPGIPQGSVVGTADVTSAEKPAGKFDGGNLPAWCSNEKALPLVYYQVLEACVRDGIIQTELVYPILIMSGLDKAVLGHIWNMANRTTPGRLTKHELFFVLGMVALAQSGQPLNVEVTSGLKDAPVPNLTRTQEGQIALKASADNIRLPMGRRVVSTNTDAAENEFADFQVAGSKSDMQAISAPSSSSQRAPSQPATTMSHSIPIPHSKSSSIPSLSLSAAPKNDGCGIPMKATLTSTGVAVKLGDMGNLDDVGFDSRYPKEEENCYIFAGSPPDESESSGRSSPLVWDPNCIYDKLTIRSKDDSESTSSLSDRTPVDEDDEDQFDDFKSAPSSGAGIEDFSEFQMAALKDDKKKSDSPKLSSSFVFEKVKPTAIAKGKDLPSIPPPQGSSTSKDNTVDDFGMFMSSGSQIGQPSGQAKLNKFASFDVGMISSTPQVSIPKPPAVVPGPKEFTEFKQAGKMETTFGVFQDSPKKSLSMNDFKPYQATEAGASKKQAPTAMPEDDFADFTQFKHSASEGDLMNMTPASQDDKYAALRDLTMTSSASQPEFAIGLAATPEELDEDDFEDFQQAAPVASDTSSALTVGGADQSKPTPSGALSGINLDMNIPPPTNTLDDGFADFQQADVSTGSGLYGFVSSDVTVITTSAGSTNTTGTIKPAVGSNFLSAAGNQSNSWLDNIPLDREPPPDDDFGDFQTTFEPMKSTPDTLSIGKSDDSGSLNDFKKASASDLYGMEFDSFGAVPDEEAPKSPALNLDDQPTPDEPPKQVDPMMAFSSHSSGKLPKVNDISSLDLTTLDLDLGSKSTNESRDAGSGDGFGDFSSAPVMSPMDSNNLDLVRSTNPPPISALVSSAPLVPEGTAFIGDRYSQVAGEIQDDNRHTHEWKRCLESCYASVKKANDVFNGISSSSVCNEVIRSTEGSDYLTAVIEIYRVACRIVTSMKAMGAETEELQELEKDIDLVWNNLSAFLAASPLHPDDGSFVFKTAVLRPEPANKDRACGVCLLNVDSRSKAFDHSKDNHKLSYGGRQYHATCANLWVNMVDSLLPALPLNSLL